MPSYNPPTTTFVLDPTPVTRDLLQTPGAKTLAMENAFARPIATVLANFQVDDNDGLSNKQIEALRAKHGRNGAHFSSRPCCPPQSTATDI